MLRTILIYSVALAVLTGMLKFIEYRFWVRDFSLELYLGAVAMLFTGLGVWAGLRLTRKKVIIASPNSQPDEQALARAGISKREYEVLQLIAQGLSNQQIAEKLFVSINTVKTHSANLFMKLDVRRRTQAIQRAKELQIL